MTTIEDRLRAATRAAAETVAPGSAPPLRLPGDPSHGRAARWRPGGPRRRRRWAGWLTPLAAAAAVTGVIVGTLAISGAIHGGPPRGGYLNPEQVPAYYVALAFTGVPRTVTGVPRTVTGVPRTVTGVPRTFTVRGNCCQPVLRFDPITRAVVRATATGAVLATIAPPKPYATFVGVTAAADDRTFVLGAQQDRCIPVRPGLPGACPPATKFFLLRINPASASASGRARLTPLPIPAEPGSNQLWNFALSPQGTSLAVLIEQGVQVFDLATGTARMWELPVPGTKFHRGLGGYFALGGSATNAMLAWGNGHTLAWVYYGGPPAGGAASGAGIRFLDTRAPGTNLLAASRLVVPQPNNVIDPGSYWRQALSTADGRAVFAVLELFNHRLTQKLAEFSARTGRLVRVLNHIPIHGNYEQVLWASASGRRLVVTGTQRIGNRQGQYLSSAGVLTGDHFKPIPWTNNTFAAAW